MKLFVKDLNEVPEALRGEYKKVEGGEGYMQVVPDYNEHPEFKAVIKNKNDILEEKRKEVEKRQAAEDKVVRAETTVGELQRKIDQLGAKLPEDFQKQLDAEKLAGKTATEALQKKLDGLKEKVKTNLIKGTTDLLAKKLCGDDNALLMEPHLQSRFEVVEETDGEFKLLVKGADGKPTGQTIDQLEAELRADKRYAALIKGRDSNGGDTRNNGGGGGDDLEKYFDRTKPEFSLSKQLEIEKSDKATFDRLAAKFDLSKP